MLKDITLGQYFPGTSIIHRLDPRTKLIMLVLYIVALFMASGWIAYGLLFACLVWIIRISTIPVKSIVKGMKPLVMILVFTGLLNLFFTREGRVLVNIADVVVITSGGLSRAAMMVARILMLITCTFLLTYTTSPIALTDGLEALMNRGTRMGIRALARSMRLPFSKSAPRAFWAHMILSVSSMSVGINRRAMHIIILSSWTGTRIFFSGFISCSRPSVREMGEVV